MSSAELAAVDADFAEHGTSALAQTETTLPAVRAVDRFTSDEAIEQHREMQRFLIAVVGSDADWPIVEGKKEPPASEIMKLWSPLGCEAEIISRNEHGELGVRREIITCVGYKTKKITKTKRNGETYEKEVADYTQPYEFQDVKFSISMMVRSRRLGASIPVTATQLASEKPVPESFHELQVQTRARKKALRILAGLSPDDHDQRKNARAFAQAQRAPEERVTVQTLKRIHAEKGSPDGALGTWLRVAIDGFDGEQLTNSQSLKAYQLLSAMPDHQSEDPPPEGPPPTDAQRRLYFALVREWGMNDEERRAFNVRTTKKTSSRSFGGEDFDRAIEELRSLIATRATEGGLYADQPERATAKREAPKATEPPADYDPQRELFTHVAAELGWSEAQIRALLIRIAGKPLLEHLDAAELKRATAALQAELDAKNASAG